MSTGDLPKQRQLVELLAGLAREQGRAADGERLLAEANRAPGTALMVVVAGEAKRGKSTLVNALLDRPNLSPVDADVATSIHAAFRYAATDEARVVHDAAPEGESVAVGDLGRWMTRDGNPDNERGVRSIEVGLDHPLLASGIVLVDTPGVGGLEAAHAQLTKAVLLDADVLIFVVDASAPITRAELNFLEDVTDRIATMGFALAKCDLYPDWREILEEDRRILASTRFVNPRVFVLRAALADKAAATADPVLALRLRQRSGVDDLAGLLTELATGKREGVRRANLRALAKTLIAQLEESDRVTLDAAQPAPSLGGELAAAQQHIETFRRERRQVGSRSLPVWADDLTIELEETLERELTRIERRLTEPSTASATATTRLATELELELDALITRINSLLVERVTQLLTDVAADLELSGLGRIEVREVTTPAPVAATAEAVPASGPETVLDYMSAASSGFSIGRVLGVVGTLIPGGQLLTPILGLGVALLRVRMRSQTKSQQQARAMVTASLREARGTLTRRLRQAINETRRRVTDELERAMDTREQELAEAIRQHKAVAAASAEERRVLERAARQRLARLSEARRLLQELKVSPGAAG